MAFYAGKNASVQVGVGTYAFKQFSLSMDGDILDVTNFTSGGYKTNIAGLVGGSLRLSGPYDAGSMPLIVGTAYTVVLTIGGAITFTVVARVKNISPSTDVARPGELSVTMETTGSFTAAVA